MPERNLNFEELSKPSLVNIFSDANRSYINELHLYVIHFQKIPNLVLINNINCKKARAWFRENYTKNILNYYFSKVPYQNQKKARIDDEFYFIDEDLMVNFDGNNNKIRLLFYKTDITTIEKLEEAFYNFTKRKTKKHPILHLLLNTQHGLTTESMKISKPKLNITDNYNDDFQPIHKVIHERLLQKNDKGIVLLHGQPGTGKTSYIRYLVASVKKNVIFLPPNMAGAITNPDLLGVLTANPNSIFVIEDAENIVIDRERNGTSPVSALLNLSDGLLSDCLNIQIICSFNTDLSKVDSALLRKGRLIAKYEFKPLETYKAQQLSEKLGFSTTIDCPTTLTDIYNQKEMNFQSEKRRAIGF